MRRCFFCQKTISHYKEIFQHGISDFAPVQKLSHYFLFLYLGFHKSITYVDAKPTEAIPIMMSTLWKSSYEFLTKIRFLGKYYRSDWFPGSIIYLLGILVIISSASHNIACKYYFIDPQFELPRVT